MSDSRAAAGGDSRAVIKALTFAMFMMFAMTTDSVGVIIPQVIKEFGLSMTAAGAFHYATMSAIALAGILLGHLADRLGRKNTIILGLAIFAVNSYLFAAGHSFAYFLTLLTISGASIGIFKTGALALIGDISSSTREHTSTMNAVEGFFGVGAIVGPAIVSYLIVQGVSWKWLYVIAGTLCVVLIAIALLVKYPQSTKPAEDAVDLGRTLRMIRNRYALAFSLGAFLYVAVECAVYVWMPTLLADYQGTAAALAPYAISVFFVLRAGGRFLGAWMLAQYEWTAVTTLFSLAILGCFVGSIGGGAGGRRRPPAPLRALHVDHLSHAELEGHQLLPEGPARRRGRGDPVLLLRGRGPGPPGHGRGQRRLRPSPLRLRSRHRLRGPAPPRSAVQLDLPSRARPLAEPG